MSILLMNPPLTLTQSNVLQLQRLSRGRPISSKDTCSHSLTKTHAHHRFILHAKKTAFVVEHDFIMATYLSDRVIVFEGTPSLKTQANRYGRYYIPPTNFCLLSHCHTLTPRSPNALLPGMNKFLTSLDITFRRDSTNYRPRINKKDSVKVCCRIKIFQVVVLLCMMYDKP